ncbi:MAG TPA: hypothetical protein VKW76_12235 [Candidatus Binatia bacterium]|nr:hypothetical protein [Candidatus Binatia bacterium]
MTRRSLALATLLVSQAAGAASPRFVDYIYVEANEGGSSGGHAAIRFGDETYHFQHEPPGLLRLRRDDSQHFRCTYGALENRPMHVSRIGVSEAVYSRLRGAFAERYLVERETFEHREALRDDRALLEVLVARRRGDPVGSVPLRGAGFFLPDDGASPPSASALEVRRRIEEVYGRDAIPARIAEVSHELDRLVPALPEVSGPASLFTYSFSARYRDLLTALVALRAVAHALPLRPESRWPAAAGEPALDDAERRTLGAFADRLVEALPRLLHSDRPDWGFALLVGLARLATLRESQRVGRLVLLDAFPPASDVVPRSYVRQHRDALSHLLADARDEFTRARACLRAAGGIGEVDFTNLEDAGNRLLELQMALAQGRDLRVWSARLVPSRVAPAPDVIVPDVPTDTLVRALSRARAAERGFVRRLERDYRYDLVSRNCVSEIFRTVDAAGAEPGRHVDLGWSLDFIPFVSARAVNGAWNVAERTSVPSYRLARLEGMSRGGGFVRAWLRECNVVTSTIYRRNPDDSFFLLFTDDVVALRPVFGVVNLIAGLGAGALGLALLPVDGGHMAVAGLRGVVFSLPELGFVNLRKGSFDYVRRDECPVEELERH